MPYFRIFMVKSLDFPILDFKFICNGNDLKTHEFLLLVDLVPVEGLAEAGGEVHFRFEAQEFAGESGVGA